MNYFNSKRMLMCFSSLVLEPNSNENHNHIQLSLPKSIPEKSQNRRIRFNRVSSQISKDQDFQIIPNKIIEGVVCFQQEPQMRELEKEDDPEVQAKKLLENSLNKRNSLRESLHLKEYIIERTKEFSLKGHLYSFSMKHDQGEFYINKSHYYSEGSVFIQSTHSSEVFSILYGNHSTTFSLRKNNQYGDEIMNLCYFISNAKDGPKQGRVAFFRSNQSIQTSFLSRLPIKTENGWLLNLSGREAMKSIKNAVFIDDNGKEQIIITKTQDNSLKVEINETLDPLFAFTLGVCNFICKL